MKLPIPCTVVTGALGTGKTTCLQDLIRNKPHNERWAIIVNEFGAVGIDGAILGASADQQQDVSVRELAGGCMCCTLSGPFGASIAQVIRQAKPDRLLIEPSGLGHPAGLLDVLQGEHLHSAVQVNAVVCLVNIGSHRALEESTSYFDQVNIADVIVGNKSDLVSPETIADFHAWGGELWPPKAQVHATTGGKLPGSTHLLDLRRDPVFQPLFAAAHSARRKQQHQTLTSQGLSSETSAAQEQQRVQGSERRDKASDLHVLQPQEPLLLVADASPEHVAAGWMFHPDDVFDQQGLLWLLNAIASSRHVQRIKGVFRVQRAGASKSKWVVLKQHQGAEGNTSLVFDAICYRRESRVELIAMRPVQANARAAAVEGADLDIACRTGNWAAIESCLEKQLVTGG
ncbi:CobW/HypB/UreG, nucleotide-binding domain-containing protein [Dunaliella salina]|uniref:CobW/HypB/UreG, nucleotide-binding domain-containing protein n=1 Tax=Dunaliella salina TaxID=3046 RepID=A0ABQ7GJ17_DUNSA|nr:CobW/HypB/UreG, nucleotide-binding domain-containing protein [Dunaliella salina]|eukprot:KAF5834602.1 CobW/HypB/UreG, nucleotide-binding domain-containing protein [Dunaliella salina]